VLGRDERCAEIVRAVQEGTCLVARLQGMLAGYAIHDRSLFGRPFLALLIVEPHLRRRGVGTALVRQVEAVVEGDRPFTSTNGSNHPMQRLCKRLGFIDSGRIDNLDPGDPDDPDDPDDPEVIYIKWLR